MDGVEVSVMGWSSTLANACPKKIVHADTDQHPGFDEIEVHVDIKHMKKHFHKREVKNWCYQGSNLGPSRYQHDALPTVQ